MLLDFQTTAALVLLVVSMILSIITLKNTGVR